ncbi:MAG: hypothetical protein ACE3JN_02515 [Ectobacillus sp.]
MIWIDLLIGNERRRLQRGKRLGPARGKRPPVVENQQPSVTELTKNGLTAKRVSVLGQPILFIQ